MNCASSSCSVEHNEQLKIEESMLEQDHTGRSHMLRNETDIAIIGAGIGGCVAAMALAPHYSVTLIDIKREQQSYLGESLPLAAKHILDKLALEDVLNSHLKTPQGMISDWGNDTAQLLGNLRDPDGLGWMVNHQMLEKQLRENVVERGVSTFWSSDLEGSEQDQQGWVLTLSETPENNTAPCKQVVRAKVVIDATGRQATFAKQQGARYKEEDSLVSVWMTYRSTNENEMSSIHPSENGWWYSAPLPDSIENAAQSTFERPQSEGRLMLLSYQTDSDLLEDELSNSTDALLKAAKEVPELAQLLDAMEPCTEIHCGVKAVNSSRLIDLDHNNWFAIGDAAMSLDPLSSQALFQAMASAMQLSELIMKFGIDTEVGKTTIAFEFEQQLERIWHQLEAEKLSYYAQERRWCRSKFWERRAA